VSGRPRVVDGGVGVGVVVAVVVADRGGGGMTSGEWNGRARCEPRRGGRSGSLALTAMGVSGGIGEENNYTKEQGEVKWR